MRIPKELKERVYEIVFYEAGEDFEEDTYEVNLEDGWLVGESGLHYCNTQKEVIELLKEAEYKEEYLPCMEGIRKYEDGYKVEVYDNGFVFLSEVKDGKLQDCVFATPEEAQRARDEYYEIHRNT